MTCWWLQKNYKIKFSLILTWLVDHLITGMPSHPYTHIFPSYSHTAEVVFVHTVSYTPLGVFNDSDVSASLWLACLPPPPLSSPFFLLLSITIRMMSPHRSTVTPGWLARCEPQSWCMYLREICQRLRMSMATSPTHTSHHWRWVLLPSETSWETAAMVFHMSSTHPLSDAIISR